MALAIQLQMQFAGGTAWTNVWDDVRIGAVPVVARYGISGNGPLDLIASTGQLTFALDNSANNSGGVAGYYSPDHASVRSGFEHGIEVRLLMTNGGTSFYKFRGTLDDIDVLPFTTRERLTYCTVLDWMDEAAKESFGDVPTQVGKRVDEIIGTVVAAMPRQPAATSYAQGGYAYPYSLDGAMAETPAMSELARAVMSDLGALFVKGDQVQGGTLRFQDRRARQSPGSALTTLSNTMQGVKVRRPRARLYNRVKATVHPRKVDAAATTVLYTLDQSNPPAIAAGETIAIEGRYTDPTLRAVRVGGVDMVTPVADTDYAMGTGPEDFSLTADLTVSATFGSTGVTFELTNGGTSTGYITLLQARGRGLYDYAPLTMVATNQTSRDDYGGQKLEIDLPYETSPTVGQSIADYWLGKLKDPRLSADDVEFLAHDGNSALMTAMLQREVGDVIALTETLTAMSAVNHFINQVELTLMPNNVVKTKWLLAPRYDTGSYWVLGTSALGTGTILGL